METTTGPAFGGDDDGPDALADAASAEGQGSRNFARVGSQRPSSLLFTYGPGAIIDLPNFTVMTSGYRSMERIYKRRTAPRTVTAPRLLDLVKTWLGPEVEELREFPWAPTPTFGSTEGDDLGVDTIVFPQWMRCTGCDLLAKVGTFSYRNAVPRRPDLAEFRHEDCTGRRGPTGQARAKKTPQPVVTARYLLACTAGHLDEFPYDWWVHEGGRCPKARDSSTLGLRDVSVGGGNAVVECRSCGASRTMTAARGEQAAKHLPRCRGRHPHLDGFDPQGCSEQAVLMLVGASNLWFPTVTSVVVMPSEIDEVAASDEVGDVAAAFAADPDELAELVEAPKFLRRVLREHVSVEGRGEAELTELAEAALARLRSGADDEGVAKTETDADEPPQWDPVELLRPEWDYLLREPAAERWEHEASGLTLSPRPETAAATPYVSRVLAVDKLRKVNALLGFTRLDDFDRVSDPRGRLVALDSRRPRWTVATADQGEGIFVQLDETAVAAWEEEVQESELWAAHRSAYMLSLTNRLSQTAGAARDPDETMPPPRYWLVHTFAHLLMRRMAMSSGYGGASITERLYAWQGRPGREPAAGVLLATTASDSEGTLGGLVRLSREDRLPALVESALAQAMRCSSDPVCGMRLPRDGEDFLHGAACHCCTFLPETSCERGNRFLDRRLLVPLSGPYRSLAFTRDDQPG